MAKKKNLFRSFMVFILIFMPIVLCSCEVAEVSGVDVLDSDVNEITQKEFLEYLKANDTGITDADLEGVDIDDFIKTGAFTVDHLGRYNLKVILNAYKQNKATELKESIMAKEIRKKYGTPLARMRNTMLLLRHTLKKLARKVYLWELSTIWIGMILSRRITGTTCISARQKI